MPQPLGKGACFQSLAEILAEHPDYEGPATNAIFEAYRNAVEIRKIEDRVFQYRVIGWARAEALAYLDRVDWPDVVHTHTRNCVWAIYKKLNRENLERPRQSA